MTENLKKYLEEVSKNEELAEKLNEMDKDAIIASAKELGIALTDADFEQPAAQELDDDELDTVAGGGACYCALGGGGKKDGNDYECACVLAGAGDSKKFVGGTLGANMRCFCSLGGYGKNM